MNIYNSDKSICIPVKILKVIEETDRDGHKLPDKLQLTLPIAFDGVSTIVIKGNDYEDNLINNWFFLNDDTFIIYDFCLILVFCFSSKEVYHLTSEEVLSNSSFLNLRIIDHFLRVIAEPTWQEKENGKRPFIQRYTLEEIKAQFGKGFGPCSDGVMQSAK